MQNSRSHMKRGQAAVAVVASQHLALRFQREDATTMFVRFRRQANRLQASLIETRRAGGKIVTKHIGALGSVDAAVSVRERLAFWSKIPARLAKLGNRVSHDEHPKLYAALHANPRLTERRGGEPAGGVAPLWGPYSDAVIRMTKEPAKKD